MAKLAVYTIAKNEIQFLDNWIQNMLPADYIVVLDTGSTDSTYERLLEWQSKYPEKIIAGQKTYENWRFDVARNDNLDMCPEDTDIYISIDLDEKMTPEDKWVDMIKAKWVPGVTQRGSYLYTWSFTESGKPGRVFWYNKLHDKHWRWFAPVHELLKSTETNSEHYDYNVSVTIEGLMLEHHPDRTKSRGNYLPLLELRKKENPDDWYGLIYLAHEYNYRGKYQESIDQLKEILERYAGHYNSLDQASCYLFMGDDYMQLKMPWMATQAYWNAVMLDPTYREGWLGYAKACMELGLYDMARSSVLEGLRKSKRHYSWLERDSSWSYEPDDLLCQIEWKLGDYEASYRHSLKALEYEPENERLISNMEICKAQYLK